MAVKYADSYDGSVGFSDSPTGKSYYGLRNSDTSAESTNPADYVWYQATVKTGVKSSGTKKNLKAPYSWHSFPASPAGFPESWEYQIGAHHS